MEDSAKETNSASTSALSSLASSVFSSDSTYTNYTDHTDTSKSSILNNYKSTSNNYEEETLDYKIPHKPKDDQKNIVRIPKTDKNDCVKVKKNGYAKCKTRVAKFDKNGVQKLLFNGNFKYGFTKLRKFGNSLLALFIICIIAVGCFTYYAFTSVNTSLQQGAVIGDLTDAIMKGDPLQVDQYGRTNIVIFGTSEDDEDHGGAQLTDSIMILSFDPETGAANTLSIPRDLTYNDKKESNSTGLCSAGRVWKVNVAYYCGMEFSKAHDDIQKERDGVQYAADVIGDITGLEFQYAVKVNYQLLVNVVDLIGGIDITPYSDDPRGIMDMNVHVPKGMNTDLGFTDGAKLQYLFVPPGKVHVNGWIALGIARARNDAGGYGLSRSNFDREINQQIILNGIREKASSSGILLNPMTILDLVQKLGNNIISNIPTSQFKSFGKAANNMANAVSVPLIGTADSIELDLTKNVSEDLKAAKKEETSENAIYLANGMVTTGASNSVSGSVVKPNLGEFNFSGIRAYIRAKFDGKTNEEIALILKNLPKSSNTYN